MNRFEINPFYAKRPLRMPFKSHVGKSKFCVVKQRSNDASQDIRLVQLANQ